MYSIQAVVLGEFMTKHPDLVRGKKVLELGAGTGLAGLVAASLGMDEKFDTFNSLIYSQNNVIDFKESTKGK